MAHPAPPDPPLHPSRPPIPDPGIERLATALRVLFIAGLAVSLLVLDVIALPGLG